GNGVGASIAYAEAHGNANGMPRASDGDNRYDPLLCTTHSGLCTANPDQKQWSVQVVTSIVNSGKDTSALTPATTTYQYVLTKTVNLYSGDGSSMTSSCDFSYTTSPYKPCEVLLISSTTTFYEQTGSGNTSAPSVTQTFTYDDYDAVNGLGDYHQAPAGGAYG